MKAFQVEALVNNQWELIAEATTIGYKRILCFPMVDAKQLRLKIIDAKASPVISNIGVYKAPEMVSNPAIIRNKAGIVTINCKTNDPRIQYTLDGSMPGPQSKKYIHPFALKKGGKVNAVAIIDNGERSEVVTQSFDICKEKWSIHYTDSYHPGFEADLAIDGNPGTMWHTNWGESKTDLPHKLQINLGETHQLFGLTYTPRSDNSLVGIITKFNCYVSMDGIVWEQIITNGEFSNILNNPIQQEVRFGQAISASYLCIETLGSADHQEYSSINEIGILTK